MDTHMWRNLLFRDAFRHYDQVFLIHLWHTSSVSRWDNDLYKDSQNGKLNMGTWVTRPSYSKAHDTRPLANIIYFHPENIVVKLQIFSWIRNLCPYIIHDIKKEGDSPFKKQ